MEKARIGLEEKIKELYKEKQKNLADYAGSLESRIDKITKEALDVKNDLAAHALTLIRKKEEITDVLNQFAKVEKSAAGFKVDFQESVNRLSPVMKNVETVEKRVDEVQRAAQTCNEFISGISSSAECRIQALENTCREKITAIDDMRVEYEKRYFDLSAENESLRDAVMRFNESSSSFWKRLKWLFAGINVKDKEAENVENQED
jgi:chromosome segregation ATPase